MMKQKKELVILLLLLAGSIAMYAGSMVIKKNAYPKELASAETPAQQSLLSGLSAADIVSMEWNNGSEDIKAVREEGTWALQSHPDLPLLVSRTEEMADALVSLKTDRMITGQDAKDYGLDPAAQSLAFETADGSSHTLSIGNKASVEDAWYVMLDDTGKIGLASTELPSMLTADIYKLVRNESMKTILSPDRMEIQRADGSSLVLVKPEDPEKYAYTDYYTWFVEDNGTLRALDRGKAEDLVNTVLQVKWQSCVNYHINYNKDVINEYGFDHPALRAEVEGGGEAVCLLSGAAAGEGLCYAQPEGSDMAYTIKSEDADKLERASYDSLRPEDICHMNWSRVSEISITADGRTRNIGVKASEPGTEEKYIYTENGAVLDYQAVTDIKAMIDKMVPAKQLEDASYVPSGEPVLKIVFRQDNEAFGEMELEFYRYSDMYDLVRFNGETRQLISVHAADAVRRLTERLN